MATVEEAKRAVKLARAKSLIKQSAPPAESSFLGSLNRGVNRGFSFGLDSVMAGLGYGTADFLTGGDFSEGYAEGRKQNIDQAAVDREKHPIATSVGEIGGGMVGGGKVAEGVFNAAKSLPMWARAGLYPTVGATEGAVYGAATAKPGEVADGTKEGAMWGATLGTIFPATIFGVKAAWRAISPRLNNPGKSAAQIVLRKLDAMELTPEQAMKELDRLGKEASVADLGKPTSTLAQTVSTKSPRVEDTASKWAIDRKAGHTGRLLGAVDDANPGKAVAVDESQKISGLWKKVKNAMIPVDSEFVSLMKRPIMRKAFETTRNSMANKGDDFRIKIDGQDIDIDELIRRIESGEIVEIRGDLMHRMKRRLDGIIEPKRDAKTGVLVSEFSQDQLDDMQAARKAFRDYHRGKDPAYAEALDLSSAQNRISDSFELASDVLSKNSFKPDVIRARLNGMTPQERYSFERGFIQAIDDELQKNEITGRNVSNYLQNRAPKIKAVFGERADAILDKIFNENRLMANVNNVVGGSPTQARQAASADFNGEVLPYAAATGDVSNIIPAALSKGYNFMTTPRRSVAEEIGAGIFQKGDAANKYLESLLPIYQRQFRNDQLAPIVSGGLLGGALSQQ